MKRNEWTFSYKASRLAEAALEKHGVHTKKKAWWEAKKKQIVEEIGKTGIEVHDSVASGYSSTKGVYGPEVVIDARLQRDLSECQNKIREHDRLINAYAGWAQVMKATAPEATLELHHDDFLFFFAETTSIEHLLD